MGMTPERAMGDNGDEWSATSHSFAVKRGKAKSGDNPSSLADLLASAVARETKLSNLIVLFDKYLPSVEGDKVTFIGSTLQEYGVCCTLLQPLYRPRHVR